MKFLIIFSTVLVFGASYDAMYDNFDAEGVAANPAALEAVMKCLSDLGPCNEQGTAFKGIISDVVMTTCAKCTPRQKEILKIVVGATKIQYPELYDAFKKRNDPGNAKGADLDAFVSRR